jgi:hypothetical protein
MRVSPTALAEAMVQEMARLQGSLGRDRKATAPAAKAKRGAAGKIPARPGGGARRGRRVVGEERDQVAVARLAGPADPTRREALALLAAPAEPGARAPVQVRVEQAGRPGRDRVLPGKGARPILRVRAGRPRAARQAAVKTPAWTPLSPPTVGNCPLQNVALKPGWADGAGP